MAYGFRALCQLKTNKGYALCSVKLNPTYSHSFSVHLPRSRPPMPPPETHITMPLSMSLSAVHILFYEIFSGPRNGEQLLLWSGSSLLINGCKMGLLLKRCWIFVVPCCCESHC